MNPKMWTGRLIALAVYWFFCMAEVLFTAVTGEDDGHAGEMLLPFRDRTTFVLEADSKAIQVACHRYYEHWSDPKNRLS